MKLRGGIICLTVLLVAGFLITPALGSANKASYMTTMIDANNTSVTLEFVDCTGITPLKKEVTLSKAEWTSIRTELQTATKDASSASDAFLMQLAVFQKHGLVSQETNSDSLLMKFKQRSSLHQIPRTLALNNTLFSAMSAITYTLENGTTAVFGLNTFINWIGFDIVSFHKGYAVSGITTNGLISKSVPPGQYVGAMFGFFGYWYGTKTTVAVYSDVTVAGLTIITGWLPIE
jgi:hypothetical protein